MPKQKQYNNRGIIFKNQFKTEDKQPDFTDKTTINNEEYKVAGWWNYRQDQPPFMSLSYTKDDAIVEKTPEQPTDASLPDDVDDDFPF